MFEADPKAPMIMPVSGSVFDDSLTITMKCETPDAKIRYTTDGSLPSAASPLYKKFRIYHKTTIKAIAFLDDGTPSEVAVAEFSKGLCERPIIASSAEFTGTKNKVTISCSTPGAIIHFTTDGSVPTKSSPIYEKPFCITNSCLIKTYAEKFDYFDSEISELNIVRLWSIGETMGKPDHLFETGGDEKFQRCYDLTATLGESMKSGPVQDTQTSILSTRVMGPGILMFKWKTSCEEDVEHKWDHAECKVDGKVVAVLDGETGWISYSYRILGEGEHTVVWRYVKDDSEYDGEDCMWVSEYSWKSDYSETQTTDDPVPYSWLTEKCCDVVDEYDSYEKVAKQMALNGRLTVEQCYVAGIDPESATNDFRAIIKMIDGGPKVTWAPDLKGAREYKIWGKANLDDGSLWQYPTNAFHRFFKVMVELP